MIFIFYTKFRKGFIEFHGETSKAGCFALGIERFV